MSDIDLSALQASLQHLASQGRSALLPALQTAQTVYGYIPTQAVQAISHTLRVPLADIQGVIDFYSLLYDRPTARRVARICTDPVCALRGGDELLSAACEHAGSAPGSPSPDGRLLVEHSTCLGLCEHAPAALVDDQSFANLERQALLDALDGMPDVESRPVRVYGEVDWLTRGCRQGTPTLLESYRQGGGYQGLQKALGLSPSEVIAEIKIAGLVGRGGAAFPTGLKWEGAASTSAAEHYVVCNADESEPGTFKDRVLLEGDPHLVIEGLAIAGYAIRARLGYIYLRGEYPEAFRILNNALQEARQAGLLGENILGSGWSFEIELRRGAGAYICGEETALFESIEGKRGYPRLKPPFPTTHGLFGQPTAINNVETLCNAPLILGAGAAAYRNLGTEKSPGPKLFCVSGDVVRPGVYEVPFGVTLRHLLFDLAGGVAGGHSLQAVLMGGAAGAWATLDQLDIPLAFETLRAAGLPLGSGVVMVFDERRDLRNVLLRLARFFAHESCGKCYPCQMGTQRQVEILARAAAGKALPGDIERLQDVGWTMTDASICGLGQTAASAVLSALKLWPTYFQPGGASYDR